MMDQHDITFIQEVLQRFGKKKESTIPILQAIQNEYRYLPREVLLSVCRWSEITPADLMGVATFYSQFRLEPVGKHIIRVCTGTACHVKGASLVLDAFRQELGIAPTEDTDKEQNYTIQQVACLGCCTLAPVVQIDHKTYGHVSPATVSEVLTDFEQRIESGPSEETVLLHSTPESLSEIRVGLGSCCQAQGSRNVYDSIVQTLDQTGIKVPVKAVGCVGMCHQVPLVEMISKSGNSSFYAGVKPNDVRALILHHHKPASLWERLRLRFHAVLETLWSDEFPDPVKNREINLNAKPVCTFLEKQVRIATESGGQINPLNLNEYLRHFSFESLENVLKNRTSDEILKEVETAGIRGRGGAGFPTFRKWTAVRNAKGSQKYIICNGDEGDPGAFMDRMLLESFPFRILEGMIVAAKAVGASQGYLYIRAEYPLAVKRIRQAISILEERHFLGENILGTGFSLTLKVKEGAGAFVCGEETALLESIEGRRGMPRFRPPFPAESGLFGKPTLVNNVETYSLIPWVMRHGGSALENFGTEKSRGTKVFALAGKIKRGGLIEVPMGISIRTIVEEIGDGVAGGKKFKAVQIGGPSGGCVPESLADTSVDFESLSAVGAIMGSGGMVVLDEDDCMVDMARYFLQFTQDQSCGKCTFCRVGTKRMLEILDRLCTGKGKKGDLEQLEQLALSVKSGSLCGLGKTAPNPVLSTLRFFRDEYEAHLEGHCPAAKCQALILYQIDPSRCNGCSLCAAACPSGAILPIPYRTHAVDMNKCTCCDTCRTTCPTNAVQKVSR